jgi:thiamine-phosphate pyrophosphorylase
MQPSGSVRGEARRARLARARLYVVTGARRDHGDLAEFLDGILAAGVDVVQLREKDAEAGDLLRWGAVFGDAARRHGALFVVNDRPDVAVALDADGVHIGQNDLPADVVRRLVGPEPLIGVSTHGEEQRSAASRHADYVCVGPIHATPTKEGRPPIGLEPVRAASEREDRPWFAIGGLNEETVPAAVHAGARRIVVVRAVTEAADPAAAAQRLLELLPREPVPAV